MAQKLNIPFFEVNTRENVDEPWRKLVLEIAAFKGEVQQKDKKKKCVVM